MLDEIIITEVPPLYGCYGRIGQQVRIPIRGDHARRVLHGAINIATGAVELLITDIWDQWTHQYFLRMIRSYWRGWNILLFEDRGSPHLAAATRRLAADLEIAIRWLPVAAPELNAMDQLWRRVTAEVLANAPLQSIDVTVDQVCQHIFALTPQERLKKAGILSGNFWLDPRRF
jgi:hypothetical protein